MIILVYHVKIIFQSKLIIHITLKTKLNSFFKSLQITYFIY